MRNIVQLFLIANLCVFTLIYPLMGYYHLSEKTYCRNIGCINSQYSSKYANIIASLDQKRPIHSNNVQPKPSIQNPNKVENTINIPLEHSNSLQPDTISTTTSDVASHAPSSPATNFNDSNKQELVKVPDSSIDESKSNADTVQQAIKLSSAHPGNHSLANDDTFNTEQNPHTIYDSIVMDEPKTPILPTSISIYSSKIQPKPSAQSIVIQQTQDHVITINDSYQLKIDAKDNDISTIVFKPSKKSNHYSFRVNKKKAKPTAQNIDQVKIIIDMPQQTAEYIIVVDSYQFKIDAKDNDISTIVFKPSKKSNHYSFRVNKKKAKPTAQNIDQNNIITNIVPQQTTDDALFLNNLSNY